MAVFSWTSGFFSGWTATSRSQWRGASGEDGGEFGLDFPSSQSLASYGDLPEMRPASYGSVTGKPRGAAHLAETTTKLQNGLQQILAFVAVVWMLYTASHHLYAAVHGEPVEQIAGVPAPAPGTPSSAPRCPDYSYPQCEAAIHWYLSRSAKTRCQAFERVKAEGDFFKFPYSSTQKDTCPEAGCCGCSGQCSKCPPLLPECSSWRLDGAWKVAFGDGSEGKYRFDSHGHCEAKLPISALPVKWKEYDQTYQPEGSDAASPLWFTVAAAQTQCEANPECKGITYDTLTRSGENYLVYFKTVSTITPGPGSTWRAIIEEQHPHLHGSVAVAGALTRLPSDAAGTVRLDLHKASPQLFPAGSIEQLSVIDEVLQVERRIVGREMLSGTGVQTK